MMMLNSVGDPRDFRIPATNPYPAPTYIPPAGMTADSFVYWLNGFLEIANPETITKEQIQEIRNHIGLVLNKVTPVVSTLTNLRFNIPYNMTDGYDATVGLANIPKSC